MAPSMKATTPKKSPDHPPYLDMIIVRLLFVCHVLHFKRHNADVSYSTMADGGEPAQALTPQLDITPPGRVGQFLAHGACMVASIPTVHRSLEGFALVAGCQACYRPQARSHDLPLILAPAFCAPLTSIV